MKIFEKLRRKKKEKVPVQEAKKTVTELEEICGEDKEVYEALLETMFLDPRKIGVSMKEAEERAKEFEKSGDLIRTLIWYKIAGGLAIHQGDAKKVKQNFGKCQELSNKGYKILEIPERAVEKAQEYYKKYLKIEEKK